jgi:hypothetical protein
MKIKTPVLDTRTEEDINNDYLVPLLPYYTPSWEPEGDDPGKTLFSLFSWIYGRVIERYNGLPEVLLAEFLRLLGIDRLPASPAKAPAVFAVNPDCPEDNIPVASGTLIGAGKDEQGDPILFETTGSLAASPARLAAVVSAEGTEDVVYDHMDDFEQGLETTAFHPARARQIHEIYLGDSRLFDLKEPCTVKVTFTFAGDADLDANAFSLEAIIGDMAFPTVISTSSSGSLSATFDYPGVRRRK